MEININSSIQKIILDITQIRDLLGEDLLKITDKSSRAYIDNQIEIEKIIKKMSILSSEIVKIVLISKSKKNELSDGEKQAINMISDLVKNLGGAESALYKIKNQIEIVNNHNKQLAELGFKFGENLMNLQDQSRNIIAEFRKAGREVPITDIQSLMNLDKNELNNDNI